MKKLMTMAAMLCGLAACKPATEGGDVFTTQNGLKVEFHAIKHGSLAIEADGKWIYIDPVGLEMEPATDFSQWPKADYIFVTHEHGDHLDADAIALLRTENTRVITNENSAEAANATDIMINGDELILGEGWSVQAVPAYNNTEGHLQFHPQYRDNGYVFAIDGFRIYVAGDCEFIPEMIDIEGIDVAFLPCNQPYTMTIEQCTQAALAIGPKVLFPYHYGNTPVEELVQALDGADIDVRIRQYQ